MAVAKRICLIDAHPHAGRHFCHALADAYEAGARGAGHAVARVNLAELDIPLLRDPADFQTAPPPALEAPREAVRAAQHLCIIYPLWLGTMPAVMKAFFEQFARANFAIAPSEKGWPQRMLAGRSARVVVTMGMPAAAYRLFFQAHGVKGFESAVLGMAGFKPIRETLLGMVEAAGEEKRASWLKRMQELGAKAI